MARNSTVSFDQVAEAATRIQDIGVTPTVRNVREVIGRGSMGTILRLLHRWQNGSKDPGPKTTVSLDDEISNAINDLITNQVKESKEDLTAQLAEKEADAKMLLSEYGQLSDAMIVQTSELNEIRRQHDELNGRFLQLELVNKTLQADLLSERQANESLKIELAIAGRGQHGECFSEVSSAYMNINA